MMNESKKRRRKVKESEGIKEIGREFVRYK